MSGDRYPLPPPTRFGPVVQQKSGPAGGAAAQKQTASNRPAVPPPPISWPRTSQVQAKATSTEPRKGPEAACSCTAATSGSCTGIAPSGSGPRTALQPKSTSTIQASRKAAEKKRGQAIKNFNKFACYRNHAGQNILSRVGDSEVVRLMGVWKYDTGAHYPGHCSGSKQDKLNGGTPSVLNAIQNSFDNYIVKNNL